MESTLTKGQTTDMSFQTAPISPGWVDVRGLLVVLPFLIHLFWQHSTNMDKISTTNFCKATNVQGHTPHACFDQKEYAMQFGRRPPRNNAYIAEKGRIQDRSYQAHLPEKGIQRATYIHCWQLHNLPWPIPQLTVSFWKLLRLHYCREARHA